MSAFICYELVNDLVRLKPGIESFGELYWLPTKLKRLADRARSENLSELAERIEQVRGVVEELIRQVDNAIEGISKALEGLLWSEICGLRKDDICTEPERGRRALIECYKKNIVACRDVTEKIKDLEPDVRAIEAVYYTPSGSIERAIFLYRPGNERRVPRIDALAVYEKYLGVRVETAKA